MLLVGRFNLVFIVNRVLTTHSRAIEVASWPLAQIG